MHKLEISGQFVSYAHTTREYPHETLRFLICDCYGGLKENSITKHIIEKSKHSVRNTGITLILKQRELHGICKKCLRSRC